MAVADDCAAANAGRMLPVVSRAISMSALLGFSGTANERSCSRTTIPFVPLADEPPPLPEPPVVLEGGLTGGADGASPWAAGRSVAIRSVTARMGPTAPFHVTPRTRSRCVPAVNRMLYGVRQL